MLVAYQLEAPQQHGHFDGVGSRVPLGGVGGIQDWNNLNGERSLSSQDVPQRLVVSYVLDLPSVKGKKYLSGVSG